MRIAMFSYGLPVVGEKRGGIERVAHDLAEGLAERGHEVTVWSHDPAPEGAAYTVRPLPWRRFVSSWWGRRLTMGYAGNVMALLPDYGDPDVIVTHGDSLLLPVLGKPVLRVMHGSALGEAISARSPLRMAAQVGVYLQELVTPLVQTCVGVSENTRRFNRTVKRVIPLGVDQTVFRPALDSKTAEPSLLFVGAQDGRKRGALLVAWFREKIRPRHPSAVLHVVGAPGTVAEGVHYHTGVSEEALAAFYRKAWIYASPSTYEGFGLPYVEALASGTPVVATPNPGSREILAGHACGILATDEEFPNAINDLLGDADRRAEMISAGLERAREYAKSLMIDRYEELLSCLCGKDAELKAVT